tara:strand:+ start:29 stop:352 length:324 start_codon:yes stop_codon:yes gene_type:complete
MLYPDTPTVYIVQKPDEKKNILSAQTWGKLEFILSEKQDLFWEPEKTVTEIKKVLSNFNDNDYLLLIGDPALIGICTAIACDQNHGFVKFLKWDNREFKYYPVEIKL